MVEGRLFQFTPPIHAVHHLELRVLLPHVGDEIEEAVRLEVESKGVEGPESERGVPYPAVSVVPVPLPSRRLGQRSGGGGEKGSRWRVRQALQRERAALQIDPPR